MQSIRLNKEVIDEVFEKRCKEESLKEFLANKSCFDDTQGVGPYRLYVYLSSLIQGNKVDIGTHQGTSAVALSGAGSSVMTFDIEDNVNDGNLRKKWISERKIESFKMNLLNKLGDGGGIISFTDGFGFAMLGLDHKKLILLDVDPHDGIKEAEFMRLFDQYWFGGMLVLDDIHINEGMNKFWDGLVADKRFVCYDVTKYGHWTGTGIVLFEKAQKELELILE